MDKKNVMVLDSHIQSGDWHRMILNSLAGESATFHVCDYFTQTSLEHGDVAVFVPLERLVEEKTCLVIAELELFPGDFYVNTFYGLNVLENIRAHPQLVKLPIIIVCERLPLWLSGALVKKSSRLVKLLHWVFKIRSDKQRFLDLNTLAVFTWDDLQNHADEKQRFQQLVASV